MGPFTDPRSLDRAALEEGTTFAPRFDANGLITVVTLDAATNAVLMVAHMNAETLALTLETGTAHYWSRSRRAIWKKGETSGELQQVVELRTDCDQDCLVMVVRQTGRGAACHTGRQSCFYRRVILKDGTAQLQDTGLPRLFDPKTVYGA
ncbi:phosphoribosyl-AMP cyclohydrolase [Devosia sp. YIM 151766]|uniref:phosphoribosyl-AMP cyclohydrolase n=1 Tax=Devosia sp. YIM 151766 TaxID=3017325 RepID=UPI00255C6557|nr:phosphoribosyl-AMP cyclohydrolase [Devosia sp. YIM 151766]WIY51580.1 phosphoribosyl-AMP cyclohydrolase [Devosia sp. YIM 151766]